MGLGDIFEVTMTSSAGGVNLYNVFFYRQATVASISTSTVSEYVVGEFKSVVVPKVRNILSRDCVITSLSCRNLFVVDDSYSELVELRGLRTAPSDDVDTYAPLVAVSYKLRTASRAVKAGGKRFGGLPEYAAYDGEFSGAAYLAYFTELANALAEPLKVGTIIRDDVFYPIVLKRVKELVGGVAKYRLPAVLSEAIWSVVTSAIFSPFVSSQVSRKVRLS